MLQIFGSQGHERHCNWMSLPWMSLQWKIAFEWLRHGCSALLLVGISTVFCSSLLANLREVAASLLGT